MTDLEIIERYSSPSTTSFYGRMYGNEYISVVDGGKERREKDKIIEIRKESASFNVKYRNICFVWGFPGPDYNLYRFDDYGKTWAFDRDELDGEDA